MTDRPIALYVANKVSLAFSQVLSTSYMKIFLQFRTLALFAVIYRVKEHRLSSVMLKILELFTVGILLPLTVILSSSLYFFVEFMKMVAVDLLGRVLDCLHRIK